MKNTFILCIMFVLLLTSSCFTPQKKDIPKNDTMTEIVDNIKTKEQLKIVTDYKLQNLLNYFIIATLAGIAACIVLFLIKGSYTGIIGGVAGIIVLILAIVIKTYVALLAIIGLVVLIGLMIMAVIYLIRDKDALVQTILSYNEIKKEIRSPDEKTRIKANVNTIQTDETQKIVKKIKKQQNILNK